MYPQPIQQLINAFSRLPSVGQRTAERFVFHLLKSGRRDVSDLVAALKLLMERIKSCEVCWDFSDQSPCHVCANSKRDHKIICVVENSQDLQAIEKTGVYPGIYHVLRGTIRPDDEPKNSIKIAELLERIKSPEITEIILGLNPDLAGETTMLMIERKLHTLRPTLKVTRLGRGLPIGSDLEYADEITLGDAIRRRTST